MPVIRVSMSPGLSNPFTFLNLICLVSGSLEYDVDPPRRTVVVCLVSSFDVTSRWPRHAADFRENTGKPNCLRENHASSGTRVHRHRRGIAESRASGCSDAHHLLVRLLRSRRSNRFRHRLATVRRRKDLHSISTTCYH